MSSVDGHGVTSPNMLKRKKEDCAEEQLEAEIKRVALEDDTELAVLEKDNGATEAIDGKEAELSSVDEKEDRESVSRHVHLRMLCLVKQASMIVGHKGENISNIKAATSTRINVSDNVRGVPERVVYVRGTCENVARAFGMIVRSISDRHGDAMFDENKVLHTVNLLISHHLMGCVIGKHGSRLREIEVLSAARLSASPQQLIMSNDRILSIVGVADAVHIATYYVGQTIMNSSESFKAKKAIFYQPSPVYSVLVNGASHVGFVHQKHHQYHPTDKYTSSRNNKRVSRSSPMTTPQSLPSTGSGSPAIYTAAAANATAFTPKFTIPNVRIVDESVATATAHMMTIMEQEIYIDENFVGNIIGKDGKHINSIKEATGCSIYIADPVSGSPERRLTVKGTPMGSQAAIMLISNKIEIDKVNKERKK
ncbi:hypothetical protein HG536_0H03410 [Torulaspora globosa]|uniref:K Homology domain-containing protein n=1 Tax=Torulaspora globosa TaxID=48254 RepID=A0A7G3ZN80_9SACH|nr:uncharacterized protein HG536_0H03410 [Torulaspora globosa]QLL34966.1 hypothetical protein HG536_0H03410 [Torulaspora globosa]